MYPLVRQNDLDLEKLDLMYVLAYPYAMLGRLCRRQSQPRKHALDQARYLAPIRRNE